ncbi:MAG: hypothetical protein IJK63_09450 [Oscillospiraceae bacterium]|nr:hypothetical protein [Oscillospiraceae bacterium]
MTIEEQLKSEILTQYGSVRAFTTELGISYSTLDSALKRGISNAGVSTMIRVFQALNLDIENIAHGDLYFSSDNKKSASAQRDEALLSLFYQLNEEGQEKLLDDADTLVRSDKFNKKTDPSQLADNA